MRNQLSTILLISVLLGVCASAQGPRISSPTALTDPFKAQQYSWKKNITATIFWIGEKPTPRNPTPNHASSWDTRWQQSYGGYDNPKKETRTLDFRPKAFIPRQNPFYIALPYNDRIDHRKHKPEASRVIPWFKKYQPKPGETVCKGRWLQIVFGNKVCYAQWEDCGPFTTTDWRYVFGPHRPANKNNQQAGIDVSPAVRDYLAMKSGDKVHWRFIDFEFVPHGPWSKYGDNNPFVNPVMDKDMLAKKRYMQYLRELRERRLRRRSGI